MELVVCGSRSDLNHWGPSIDCYHTFIWQLRLRFKHWYKNTEHWSDVQCRECTWDFWCSSRHSSKCARVRSTDFRTLLREVLFCQVSPSAIVWYQSGCTVFWRAMNLSTVSSIRPLLPHTDTVWQQQRRDIFTWKHLLLLTALFPNYLRVCCRWHFLNRFWNCCPFACKNNDSSTFPYQIFAFLLACAFW